MGTTTGNLELTYPASRGPAVPWADSYETNLQTIDTAVSKSTNLLAGQAVKASDNSVEAIEVGTVYLPPEPFNAYGTTARMQKFTGASAELTITLTTGVSAPVFAFGSNVCSTENAAYPFGYNPPGYESSLGVMDESLVLTRGSAFNQAGDTYTLFVVYEPAV
jgi:hypothetical protein